MSFYRVPAIVPYPDGCSRDTGPVAFLPGRNALHRNWRNRSLRHHFCLGRIFCRQRVKLPQPEFCPVAELYSAAMCAAYASGTVPVQGSGDPILFPEPGLESAGCMCRCSCAVTGCGGSAGDCTAVRYRFR